MNGVMAIPSVTPN
uniref:Uncharacterized protein n=1 Tax=Arundo donax TaxID=35708 RepID=A0A0A8YXF4_ARUDO